MKKSNYKKILVLLRNVLKLFYTSDEKFEKQYYNNRVKEAVIEMMNMNIIDRFKFIEDVKGKVLEETLLQKKELSKKIEEIDNVLNNLK